MENHSEDVTIVFCKSFRHFKTGKVIFAKPGKVFRLVIRKKKK